MSSLGSLSGHGSLPDSFYLSVTGMPLHAVPKQCKLFALPEIMGPYLQAFFNSFGICL